MIYNKRSFAAHDVHKKHDHDLQESPRRFLSEGFVIFWVKLTQPQDRDSAETLRRR